MKKIFLIILFSIIILNVEGQNKYSEKITKSGNEIAIAIKTNDYAKIVDFTYPKKIKLMGGKSEMIAVVKKGMKRMENEGVKFSEILIGEPQEIFQAGIELHCLVPQKIIITNRKGKVTNNSYLLAISRDTGKTWYFLDTSQLTNENATELFPNFNKELKIPEKLKPKFESN